MHSDVLLSLRGDGNGNWLLTIELDVKEATISVGSGVVNDLKIPFNDPLHPGSVSLKETITPAKVCLYSNADNFWFMSVSLASGIKSSIRLPTDKIEKLRSIGIAQA